MTDVHDRFVVAARRDPDRFFELGVELARAHATNLGVHGVAPKSIELLACPWCGAGVAIERLEDSAACGCGWRGTVTEACR